MLYLDYLIYEGIEMQLPFNTDLPILNWRKIGHIYVVIFDYMTFPKAKPARNMIAFTEDGKEIWRTEAYTKLATDGWVNFISIEPLIVGNFSGYNATIDLGTGVVLATEFTK